VVSAAPAKAPPAPAAPAPVPPTPPAAKPPAAPTPAAAVAYSGPEPCKLATKGDNPVVRACNQGGIHAAKTAMKELTKQAKSGGVKLDCDDCHKSDSDFSQLTGEAKDKFKQLLAAAHR
jgi:hypothetical protein